MWAPRHGLRRDVAVGMSGEGAGVLLGISAPVLLKLTVDGLMDPGRSIFAIVVAIFLFALATAAGGVISAIRHHSTTRIIETLAGELSARLLVIALPRLAISPGKEGGRLFGQIERLPFNLQLLIDGIMWQVIPLLMQICISLCVVLLILPGHYSLLIAALLGGYLLLAMTGLDRYRTTTEAANAKSAAFSAHISDMLRNAPRVVLNGNISGEIAALRTHAGAKRFEASRGARALMSMALLQGAVLTVGLSILLGLAARDMLAGRMTAGDFVLIQAYVIRLAMPLGSFAFILRRSGRVISDIGTTLSLTEPAPVPPALVSPHPIGPASLTLTNISFAFADGKTVISNLSAVIPAASLVAIVGNNGSGKSTLARLMAGLLEPTEGAIAIDDLHLAGVAAADRHGYVLYVPQQISLFSRSLGENGLYPPTRLDSARLQKLLRSLRFHADGRDANLDQSLGEGGEGLSGGQAQKLEVARLSGVQVPVIILDETTSALDPVSEGLAVETLRSERRASTLILVTHRPTIAAKADMVLFISDGAIRRAGRHEALMNDTDYRAFWVDNDRKRHE